MLNYHGPKYGYVDSDDRAELNAIRRLYDKEQRAQRVERRIGRTLMYHEVSALEYARNNVDRIARRAELRKRGMRLAVHRGARPFLWVSK